MVFEAILPCGTQIGDSLCPIGSLGGLGLPPYLHVSRCLGQFRVSLPLTVYPSIMLGSVSF